MQSFSLSLSLSLAVSVGAALVVPAAAFFFGGPSYCRPDGWFFWSFTPNHIAGMWTDGAPSAVASRTKSLCEGTVDVTDAEICVTGRVTYGQLRKAVGRSVRRPAADSISITGHLLSGSGNVLFGTEANFLYDFVTKYTVNGQQSVNTGDGKMVDDLFAASRGTLDGVCFDKDTFAPEETAYYSLSHETYDLDGVDFDRLAAADSFFASNSNIITESFNAESRPFFFGIGLGSFFNSLMSFIPTLVPAFLLNVFPLLGSRGNLRRFVYGVTNTNNFPHPAPAPGQPVEDVQVDAAWDVLIDAMKDGLFTAGDGIAPNFFSVQVKRISQGGFCWNTTDAAAMDLIAPKGKAAELDAYIEDVVVPRLQKFGDVSMHMGKRIPQTAAAGTASALLNASLAFYERACGVELDVALPAADCYHPMCRRTTEISEFTYPSQYFDT